MDRWGPLNDIDELLIHITLKSTSIFYVFAIVRFLVNEASAYASRRNGGPHLRNNWPSRIVMVMFASYVVITNSFNDNIFTGFLVSVFSALVAMKILAAIAGLSLLAPHFIVAIELRFTKSETIASAAVRLILFMSSIFSLPFIMTVITTGAIIFMDGPKLTPVMELHFSGESSYLEGQTAPLIILFWINQTVQAMTLDIPESYGITIGKLEYNTSSILIPSLVVAYKLLISALSVVIVFGPTIRTILNNRKSL